MIRINGFDLYLAGTEPTWETLDDNNPDIFNYFGIKHDPEESANVYSDNETASDSSSMYDSDIPDSEMEDIDVEFHKELAKNECCDADGRITLYQFSSIPYPIAVSETKRPLPELLFLLSTPEYTNPPHIFYYDVKEFENIFDPNGQFPLANPLDPDGRKHYGVMVNMFFMVVNEQCYWRDYRKWLRSGEKNIAFDPFSVKKNDFARESKNLFHVKLSAFLFSEWVSFLRFLRRKYLTGKYHVYFSAERALLEQEALLKYSTDYYDRIYRRKFLAGRV